MTRPRGWLRRGLGAVPVRDAMKSVVAMTAEWVVVLESSTEPRGGTDLRSIQRLLEELSDLQPLALHGIDRYAVQVRVRALGHAEALRIAVGRWRAGVQRLGAGSPSLVRAEVLTLEEFELDCRTAYEGEGAGIAVAPPGAADRPGDHLLWQAFNDPLTQLPVLGFFLSHLDLELRRAPAGGARALLVVGLWEVDAMGQRRDRSIADEVLVSAVCRLQAALPPNQAVARIGGNEFATLLDAPSMEAAVVAAERVVALLAKAMRLGDDELRVRVVAGIACARPMQEAEELVAQAQAALQVSERSGRLEVHRPGLAPAAAASGRLCAGNDPPNYLLLLQRAAMASNESTSLAHAAGQVVSQVCGHLGWRVGHMYVVGEGGELLPEPLSRLDGGSHQALLGILDHTPLKVRDGSLAGRVAESGQVAWVSDLTSLPTAPWTSIAGECGLRAALAFPVLLANKVVAVLEFFVPDPGPPSDALLEILRCVGGQLSRVVERQQAQDMLKASEDRLREAHSLAQLGSWTLQPAVGASTWTDGMSEILGVGPDAPRTVEFFLQLVHPQDRSRVEAAAEQAQSTGRSGPVDFRIIRPDGEQRWVSARTSCSPDGRTFYGTILDITHAKVVEESLRKRDRQLRLAEEIAELGFWARDLLTGEVEWSDGMYKVWGVERGHFDSTWPAIYAHIDPEDRDRVHSQLVEGGDGSGSAEFRVTLPDGRRCWFRGRAVMQFDDRRRAVRVVGTIQDVTREKRAEQETFTG